MTFIQVLRMERNQRKWIYRSKKLFRRYDILDMFNYNWYYSHDTYQWFGDDYIIVGEESDEPKTYWVANNKDGYKHLKHMLKLELKIRYK